MTQYQTPDYRPFWMKEMARSSWDKWGRLFVEECAKREWKTEYPAEWVESPLSK